MSSVIYAYLCDPAFTNYSTPLPNYLKNNGGIGNISQVGLSYFLDVSILTDTRDPNSRTVAIPHTRSGSLLFDGEFDEDATTLLNAVPNATLQAIFELTDKVFFNQSQSTQTSDVDKSLTADSNIAKIYVPGSLKLPEDQVSGQYYDAQGQSHPFSTWSYLICDLQIPSGSTTVTQTFHIFCEDMAWRKYYPHSTIMSITPPISYNDLLNLPLNTAQANELVTATNTMNLAMQNFSGPQSQETATGGMVFPLKAIGPNSLWTVVTPWGILYKGQQPSVTQIRQYIKKNVEASGVGTPDQWKARFPDLYIIGRYYIVPFWDITYQMTDSVIYKGIAKDKSLLQKVEAMFPSLDATYISGNVEYFTSPYDLIRCASILDSQSQQVLPALGDIHPTYREVNTDDPSFSYMDQSTQSFSSNLIKCLAIWSGASSDPLYIKATENGINYISYTINEIEYVVISPDSYNSAQRTYQ